MTIERLRAFGDAWNRGDVDDIMSYFATECTIMPRPALSLDGPIRGGRRCDAV